MLMESDRYLRITLRIPRELHARIEAEANRTSKSQNAEIVARLEASFDEQDDLQIEEAEANTTKLQNQWNFLVMRGEVVKARMDGLLVRAMLLENERNQLAHVVKTKKGALRIADLDESLWRVREELKILTEEVTNLTNDRKALEANSQSSISEAMRLRDNLQDRLLQELRNQPRRPGDAVPKPSEDE